MAHTYGEVLERSYPNIFECISNPHGRSAIVDIGSGYAGILIAAMQQHDCIAIGIGAPSPPPPPFRASAAPVYPVSCMPQAGPVGNTTTRSYGAVRFACMRREVP